MHRISNIRPILKQFLGSSYAQNGAHEHYTAPDGQTGKYALPSNIQGLTKYLGWHYNSNTGNYSSGDYYRSTDNRHGK